MHVMLGDEADAEQGRGQKFFIYGAVFIDSENIWTLHDRMERLRRDAGFAATDSLKSAVSTRPKSISADTHRDLKSAVISLAEEMNVTFCAYVMLHAIAQFRDQQTLIQWGTNTILARFNQFLTMSGSFGLVLLDRMTAKNSFAYAKEKFQVGLQFEGKPDQRLDRITSLGFTCDGASHLGSIADIVLGSFRYCVNEPDKEEANKKMFPAVLRLMWKRGRNEREFVRECGLTLRPEKVNFAKYQKEYDDLMERLQSYLDAGAKKTA
jgi:hypothetical protein